MMDVKRLRCMLCGMPETVAPADEAYRKSQTNPGYRHVCRACSGQAGREAQSATGLNPDVLDAVERLVIRGPRNH